MVKKTVGENIRILREKTGFTQGSLAQFLGVDQSLVSKVEKGERSLSADMLERLSALFGVSVEQIEGGDAAGTGLSFAFRGSEFSPDEMEAVAAVNRIALNSEFMRVILEEAEK